MFAGILLVSATLHYVPDRAPTGQTAQVNPSSQVDQLYAKLARFGPITLPHGKGKIQVGALKVENRKIIDLFIHVMDDRNAIKVSYGAAEAEFAIDPHTRRLRVWGRDCIVHMENGAAVVEEWVFPFEVTLPIEK